LEVFIFEKITSPSNAKETNRLPIRGAISEKI
jgi:hypothetical protein